MLHDARRRLAEVPAQVVIADHAMGLYELAAIHLGAEPPDLREAALAIDAFACLVEGLDERLGPDHVTLRDSAGQHPAHVRPDRTPAEPSRARVERVTGVGRTSAERGAARVPVRAR